MRVFSAFFLAVGLLVPSCNCGYDPVASPDEPLPGAPERVEDGPVYILDPITFDFSDAGTDAGSVEEEGDPDAGSDDDLDEEDGGEEDDGPLDAGDDEDSDSDSDSDSDDVLPEPEDDDEDSDDDSQCEVEPEDGGEEAESSEDVCLCHKDRKVLCLPNPAVDAHLNHGDYLGECD